MFQARKILSAETVASLTVRQVRQVYNKRLAGWSARAGFGSDTRAFIRATDGTTWDEFRSDWESGNICVTANELPEVYETERLLADYEAAWLATAIAPVQGEARA